MPVRPARTRSKLFRPALVAQLHEAVRRRLYRVDPGAIADAMADRARAAAVAAADASGDEPEIAEQERPRLKIDA